MEAAMPIEPPKLPDNVKYAVIAAIIAAAVAAFLNISRGRLFPDGLFAVAFGAAVYYAVYTKLTTNVSAAKAAALLFAGVAAFLLLVSMIKQDANFMFINLIAAVGLGYAFMQLLELEKKTAATQGPGAPSVDS
jgi:ABC-type Mn2+/Zn2+ transport system permease subunit